VPARVVAGVPPACDREAAAVEAVSAVAVVEDAGDATSTAQGAAK